MYTYVFRSDPCTTLLQPTNPAAGTAAMADALAKYKFDAAAAATHAAQEADNIIQDAVTAVSAANAAAACAAAELIISKKNEAAHDKMAATAKQDAVTAVSVANAAADKIKQDAVTAVYAANAAAEYAVSSANAAAARVAAELIISQKHAEQLRAELQETKDSLAAAALQMKADATAGMRYPSLVTCHRL